MHAQSEPAVEWLRAQVDELLASGFLTDALRDAGQAPGLAAVSEQ
ncbi:hypothetical protein [Nocardioides sp.]|nr:hypothetical protein [Nocardioides sp.]